MECLHRCILWLAARAGKINPIQTGRGGGGGAFGARANFEEL